MASFEKVLPVEQWCQVLKMVPSKDLCNVVLTSHYMNSLASSPDLWDKTKVNKEKVMRDGLTQLYSINRFKKIKEIDVSSMRYGVTPKKLKNLFNDIQEWPVEKVDFHYTNLRGAPAVHLAKAVSHLKAVSLRSTDLTTFQSTKVLETSLSSASLEEVNLAWVNLSGVKADLLARAMCRLRTVDLAGTRLTGQQSATLLETSLSSITLVDVSLGWVDLSGVLASLLARAVCRLRTVDLRHTRLTAQQSASVIKAILSSNTLVSVSLRLVNLSGVPSDLLARAVGRLQCVNLYLTEMTPTQCIAVGQAVLSSTKLRQVELRQNHMQRNLPAHLYNSLKFVDYVNIN